MISTPPDPDLEVILEMAPAVSLGFKRMHYAGPDRRPAAEVIRADLKQVWDASGRCGLLGVQKICGFLSHNLRNAVNADDDIVTAFGKHLASFYLLLFDYLDDPQDQQSVSTWIEYLRHPAMVVPLREDHAKILTGVLLADAQKTPPFEEVTARATAALNAREDREPEDVDTAEEGGSLPQFPARDISRALAILAAVTEHNEEEELVRLQTIAAGEITGPELVDQSRALAACVLRARAGSLYRIRSSAALDTLLEWLSDYLASPTDQSAQELARRIGYLAQVPEDAQAATPDASGEYTYVPEADTEILEIPGEQIAAANEEDSDNIVIEPKEDPAAPLEAGDDVDDGVAAVVEEAEYAAHEASDAPGEELPTLMREADGIHGQLSVAVKLFADTSRESLAALAATGTREEDLLAALERYSEGVVGLWTVAESLKLDALQEVFNFMNTSVSILSAETEDKRADGCALLMQCLSTVQRYLAEPTATVRDELIELLSAPGWPSPLDESSGSDLQNKLEPAIEEEAGETLPTLTATDDAYAPRPDPEPPEAAREDSSQPAETPQLESVDIAASADGILEPPTIVTEEAAEPLTEIPEVTELEQPRAPLEMLAALELFEETSQAPMAVLAAPETNEEDRLVALEQCSEAIVNLWNMAESLRMAGLMGVFDFMNNNVAILSAENEERREHGLELLRGCAARIRNYLHGLVDPRTSSALASYLQEPAWSAPLPPDEAEQVREQLAAGHTAVSEAGTAEMLKNDAGETPNTDFELPSLRADDAQDNSIADRISTLLDDKKGWTLSQDDVDTWIRPIAYESAGDASSGAPANGGDSYEQVKESWLKIVRSAGATDTEPSETATQQTEEEQQDAGPPLPEVKTVVFEQDDAYDLAYDTEPSDTEANNDVDRHAAPQEPEGGQGVSDDGAVGEPDAELEKPPVEADAETAAPETPATADSEDAEGHDDTLELIGAEEESPQAESSEADTVVIENAALDEPDHEEAESAVVTAAEESGAVAEEPEAIETADDEPQPFAEELLGGDSVSTEDVALDEHEADDFAHTANEPDQIPAADEALADEKSGFLVTDEPEAIVTTDDEPEPFAAEVLGSDSMSIENVALDEREAGDFADTADGPDQILASDDALVDDEPVADNDEAEAITIAENGQESTEPELPGGDDVVIENAAPDEPQADNLAVADDEIDAQAIDASSVDDEEAAPDPVDETADPPAYGAQNGGELPAASSKFDAPNEVAPFVLAAREAAIPSTTNLSGHAREILAVLASAVSDCEQALTESLDAIGGGPEQEELLGAVAQYSEVIANLTTAAESVNLSGLQAIFEFMNNSVATLASDTAADRAQGRKLLEDSLIRVRAYLADAQSEDVCRALATHLKDGSWPSPLDEDDAEALYESLLREPRAIKDEEATPRPQRIELEDVSLTLADDVDAQLREVFLTEAPGNVAELRDALEKINGGADVAAHALTAQRAAHTLKGSATLIGCPCVATLTHHMEDILEYLANEKIAPPPMLRTVMLDAADTLEAMLDALAGTEEDVESEDLLSVCQDVLEWANRIDAGQIDPDGGTRAANTGTAAILPREDMSEPGAAEPSAFARPPVPAVPEMIMADELQPAAVTAAPAATSTAEAPHPRGGLPQDYLRVPTSTVDLLMRMISELSISLGQIQEKLKTANEGSKELLNQDRLLQQRSFELENIVDVRGVATVTPRPGQADSSFDPLEMDQYNELYSTARAFIEAVTDAREMSLDIKEDLSELEGLLAQQEQISKEFQQTLMTTRMVAVNTITSRLQRAVRQTCRTTGKQAELTISGNHVLIDSDVLNKLVTPLMHLMRNAVDHGIESPEERIAVNKSETGKIELSFAREGNNIIVIGQDDGHGLDLQAILDKARQLGLISPDAELSPDDIARLVLIPGFSTRTTATHISGRGVGLDVVASTIAELKGTVDIDQTPDRGLKLSLRFPVTLVSVHCLLVKAGGQLFAVPTNDLQQIVSPGAGDFVNMGADVTYQLEGKAYKLSSFDNLLNLPARPVDRQQQPLMIVESERQLLVCLVDEVVDNRDLVITKLGRFVPKAHGIAGATILGDGSVVPLLDMRELLRDARALTVSAMKPPPEEFEVDDPYRLPRVLIVDDSLSVRRSLTHLVSDTGYETLTARDGLEAIDVINKKRPDALLVDLEMPRMNGLELTAHIRSREEIENLPIAMITSRSMEKHRKQAYLAGVTKYITKPYPESEVLDFLADAIEEARQ